MLLTGTFDRTVDHKFRFALPKPLRDGLGSEVTTLFLTPGTDNSLAMYSAAVFDRLAEQMGTAPPTGEDVRAFSRLFYAQAQRLDLDPQGRCRIPAELARWASLARDVVLLGVRDHIEIWSKSVWQEYLASKQARYDEIAENAFRSSVAANRSRGAGDEAAAPHDARPTQPR